MTWILLDVGNGYYAPVVMKVNDVGIECFQYKEAYFSLEYATAQMANLKDDYSEMRYIINSVDWFERIG